MKIVFILIVFSVIINSCSESRIKSDTEKSNIQKKENIDTLSFDKDDIVEQLIKECKQNNQDTIPNRIRKMIETIEASKSSPNELYPYSEIDSIVLSSSNNINQGFEKKWLKKLSIEKRSLLLDLLNNPLYYEWGECGTPVEEFRFVFYFRNKVVGITIVSCEGSFVECTPDNILIRFGGLNIKGEEIMKTIMED